MACYQPDIPKLLPQVLSVEPALCGAALAAVQASMDNSKIRGRNEQQVMARIDEINQRRCAVAAMLAADRFIVLW
jgi:hypothetical protein